MADNSRPVAEPLQKSAQAAQAVRGAVKTGKAIAGAAKGAAAGGVWGAVAGFAWENRKFVGKVIIAATAVLMIPILILCMLPGIIFGGFGNSHSPADPDTPIMNSSAAIDGNLTEISTAVSRVLSEALTDTLSAISELSGDLLTAGMFVALDYVWDKAKQNRTVEKTIFIDECWALIGGSANRLAANFVLEIAKIIRGYGGSAVFATQDLNDFFALDDGKYGKGIINNCKTKIVLNLEDEEAQRVQSILHLSEAEVMEITHFERGNGLISTNNNNITVEFRCSDLEKSLITTDRRELQELVEQKKR